MKKYFQVVAKCGHVGRKNYIEVAFAVVAEDIHEATTLARYIPRVKHHRKDAISSATEITYEEYLLLRSENDLNPFLKCTSSQEQQLIIDDIAPYIQEIVDPVYEKKSKREGAKYRRQKEKEYLASLSLDIGYMLEEYRPSMLCA